MRGTSTRTPVTRRTERSVDVYATSQGGREGIGAIRNSEVGLGIESQHQNRTESEYVEFVDFPFTRENQSFEAHRETVEEIQPTIAVAPDIERGRTPEIVYRQADELREHADDTIVVPKQVHPSKVPDRFRVGLPLANFGSDDTHQITDYHGCGSVHLLGGSPILQLRVIKLLGDAVDSTDGTAVFKAASMGDVFAPTQHGPHTRDRRHWFDTGDAVGFYERLAASLHNTVKAFNAPADAYSIAYDRPGESMQDTHDGQTRLSV